MMKNRVYISGKITGLSRFYYMELFAHAEAILRKHGYKTINPTKFIFCRWQWLYKLMGYRLVLLIDLWVLDKFCNRIYLIPGCLYESVGSRIESSFAYNRGIRELPEDELRNIDEEMMAY